VHKAAIHQSSGIKSHHSTHRSSSVTDSFIVNVALSFQRTTVSFLVFFFTFLFFLLVGACKSYFAALVLLSLRNVR